jgi:predicted enzyme related to lactoylglutathione lyase
MANPVNWFQISGKSAEPLVEFYGKAFDWKIDAGPGGMMFVTPEAGGIPGGIGATADGSEKSLAIYVGVSDIDAQLARIEAAGGKAAMPKMELPQQMGWIAGFLDPVGNWVGLWQAGPGAGPPPAPAKRTARKAAKKPVKKAAKKGAAKKGAAKKSAAKKSAKKKPAKKR